MGSRLLQGLFAMPRLPDAFGCDVHVVDPSEASRETARARAMEIVTREGTQQLDTISLHPDVTGLPKELDLLVLGATSRHRFGNLEDALAHSRPRMFLLEKFLFDRREHYPAAQALIAASGAPAYVHCPRAYWPIYRAEASRLQETGARAFVRVEGAHYALASNGVHFLDLARSMNGTPVTRVEARPGGRAALNKREGYREFLGTLAGADAHGPVAEMTCEEGDAVSLTVSIESEDSTLQVFETQGRWERRWTDGRTDEGDFQPLFASANHALFSDLLLDHARAPLPTLAEASTTHLAFFEALHPLIGERDGSLPVT